MPLYLSRFSYTPETWARLIGNPEDRRKAAQSYIETVGGKLHGFWYAFGTHDGYTLWEAPDNVSMAAVALANHFGQLGWSSERILAEACLLEGHPDNAAACWLGGMVVAAQPVRQRGGVGGGDPDPLPVPQGAD